MTRAETLGLNWSDVYMPDDTLRGDYPQPNCPVCGRFARRAKDGSWRFSCQFWTGEGWEHD